MKTWIILLLSPLYLNAQNFKADISVVQFSASFTKDSEISLKPFKDYNTYTFYISDKPDICLLYTSPSPRDRQKSRMPSSA